MSNVPAMMGMPAGNMNWDYNDIRISVGTEWTTLGSWRGHLEVGYVFERELYTSKAGELLPRRIRSWSVAGSHSRWTHDKSGGSGCRDFVQTLSVAWPCWCHFFLVPQESQIVLGQSTSSGAILSNGSSSSGSEYGGTRLFAPPNPYPDSLSASGAQSFLASHTNTSPYLTDSVEPIEIGPLPFEEQEKSSLPPGARDGIFQGAKIAGTWLAKPSDADFGVTELQLDSKFGLPLPFPGAESANLALVRRQLFRWSHRAGPARESV